MQPTPTSLPHPHAPRRRAGTAEPAVRRYRSSALRWLRYVDDTASSGIRRLRHANGFRYVAPNGRPVRDTRTLARIRALAIPPAWTGVWICPRPDGHLQATGRDARGRKQYRYHADFRELRDRRKFERLAEFGAALPVLRTSVEQALTAPSLTREKVLAAVVALLDRTLVRIGNEEYGRSNSSYGLTTLRTHHARGTRDGLQLAFRGKSGKPHVVVLSDAHLVRLVRRCQALPGQLLFQYLDHDGRPVPVRSNDVNAFLRELTDENITAKHFRTWGATVRFLRYWRESLAAEPELASKSRVVACIAAVAKRLGNTPAVCRASYVDPRVVAALEAGTWPQRQRPAAPRALSRDEREVLAFLQTYGDR